MNKINLLRTIILLMLICISCSDSNNNQDNENPDTAFIGPDVTVLARFNDQIFQYDVLNNGNTVNKTNLSNEFGPGFGSFITIDESYPLISFFEINANNYIVYQKNLESSEIRIRQEICPLNNEAGASRVFAVSSINKLILFSQILTQEFNTIRAFAHILDTSSEQCTEVLLRNGQFTENGTGLSRRFWVQGESLYLLFIDSDIDKEVILKINLTTSSIERSIEFDRFRSVRATIWDNQLHVFFGDGQYDIYDTTTFGLLSSGTLPYRFSHPLGFFETSFDGDEMYIDISYPQPSPIGRGPAAVDLSSGELTKGSNLFFFDIRSDLNEVLQRPVSVVSLYKVDLENNVIVLAFWNDDQSQSGGILFTDFEGNLNKIVELDARPERIIWSK